MKKKRFEDMTPEEREEYLYKTNYQADVCSLTALILSFIALVLMLIRLRIG